MNGPFFWLWLTEKMPVAMRSAVSLIVPRYRSNQFSAWVADTLTRDRPENLDYEGILADAIVSQSAKKAWAWFS
jgi:hypothetical protein